MAIAGRILILPKGEYNASTTYSMLDLVSYNGASWLAKKTAVGITPSDENSAYWQKLIEVAGKQDTITGGATSITNSNLTASRALVSDANGKVAVSAVTATELGFLDGVTSNVQTQLNAKSGTGHTHNYAGSSSAGGSATTALACTGNSATATKATQDSQGQQINTTYVKGISASGNVITVTKGNGTTSTITLQAGDSATVRYNSTNDTVEIYYNGTWNTWLTAGIQTFYFFKDGMNYADFSLYAGRTGNVFQPKPSEATLNIGSSLVFTVIGGNGANASDCIVTTKAIDLSKYSTLEFTYSGVQDKQSYNFMKFIIYKTKASDITATVSKDLLAVYTVSGSGMQTIDVSNLSGEYFIAFEIACGSTSSTLTISDMTME